MIRDKILAAVDPANARGLEIGALNRPIVTRDMGAVEYVDRSNRQALQAWYAGHHDVEAADIVEVDHIWGEQSLLDCVGGARTYDYLIASHVLEHVPDLLGWLQEVASVLVDGGLAALIVPDKRFTFDVLRRTSSAAELVDAHVRGLRRPDTRQIFDFLHNARSLEGDQPEQTDARAREVLELCRRTHVDGDYFDAHCWVFTPRSLAEALDLGSRLELLPFEIAALEPTQPGSIEFLLILRRLPDALTRAAWRTAFIASRERLALPDELNADVPDDDLRLGQARAYLEAGRVAAMEASTSWRITAPLRAIARLARGDRPSRRRS